MTAEMVSAKEKAIELVKEVGLTASLVVVREVLSSNPTIINCDSTEFNYGYWVEVKKEILCCQNVK